MPIYINDTKFLFGLNRLSRRTKYYVYDTTGELLRVFNTWKEAQTYRVIHSRHDWAIREK